MAATAFARQRSAPSLLLSGASSAAGEAEPDLGEEPQATVTLRHRGNGDLSPQSTGGATGNPEGVSGTATTPLNLRQYAIYRRHLAPELPPSAVSKHAAVEYFDLLGVNGRARQRQAEKEWERRRLEAESRCLDRIEEAFRRQRHMEFEARERKMHEESERRRAEDEEERLRRLEKFEEARLKRLREREAWQRMMSEEQERRRRAEEGEAVGRRRKAEERRRRRPGRLDGVLAEEERIRIESMAEAERVRLETMGDEERRRLRAERWQALSPQQQQEQQPQLLSPLSRPETRSRRQKDASGDAEGVRPPEPPRDAWLSPPNVARPVTPASRSPAAAAR